MNPLTRAFNAVGGRLMARSGRVAVLGTTGARTGKRREAPLGYARRPDGAVIIASGGDGRAWPVNLRSDPTCTLEIRGRRGTYVASLLEGAERDDAIRDFVAAVGRAAAYTTWTDIFLLRPVDDGLGAAPQA